MPFLLRCLLLGACVVILVVSFSTIATARFINLAEFSPAFAETCSTITLPADTLPDGVVGVAYNQTIVAEDGIPPYTYSISLGALPPGLLLSTGGVISGTPTAGGNFGFTITATDSAGCSGFGSYIISVDTVPLWIITATAGGNGIINPSDSVIVADSANQNFTFTPDPGHRIDSVFVDDVYIGAPSSYEFTQVTDDHTIHVEFTPDQHTLLVAIAGIGVVDKDPEDVTYDYGTSVELTAVPDDGWLFNGWSGDTVSIDNPITILMTADRSVTATFVEDPAYQATFRSVSAESLAFSYDTKGKLGKPVMKKADKVDFKLSLTIPFDSAKLSLKFSLGKADLLVCDLKRDSTLVMSFDSLGGGTIITPAIMGSTGSILTIEGTAYNKGKSLKAKYNWTKIDSGNALKLPFSLAVGAFNYQTLRLPMPNRINLLEETFKLGGFSATGGLLVGLNRKTPVDSSKYYGWVLAPKYGDVMRSMIFVKEELIQEDDAHGFDVYLNDKPVVRAQKALAPNKYNNILLAEMIAAKLNITASALGLTPVGFGELIYDDGLGNPLNGRMVKEIVAYGDTIMMGSYNGIERVFVDPLDFDNLATTLYDINTAFEGDMDTVSFSDTVMLKGTVKLADVSYLKLDSSAVPLRIIPHAGIEDALPGTYRLAQNYPNPFNPMTTIQFALPHSSNVTMKIFNMIGQEVATLLSNEEFEEGSHEIDFDAARMASGVYFYRIVATPVVEDDEVGTGATFTSVKKMVVVK